MVRNRHLSHMPEEMNVTKIIYVSEESWGFGPGGNETGIIFYAMPDAVADNLQTDGLAYLQKLAKPIHKEWRGRYPKWQKTPIVIGKRWYSYLEEKPSSPRISHFMFYYGFRVPLNPRIENMVDEAISSEGSYYAYGRRGLIILMPQFRRIVYAYRG